jgi:transcription initiation factor TFIID subunit TAF12
MQSEQNLLSKPKDASSKEFYRDSMLKYEVISELCKEISNSESLDLNVEKFLVEIADNYVSSVLDTACQIARHKRKNKSEEKAVLTTADLSIAMGKLRKKFIILNHIS